MSLKKLKKAAEKRAITELSFEEQFIKDYNTAYLTIEMERKQSGVPKGYYRPSSLGGGCKRMLAFQAWGVKEDEPDLSDEWTYNGIRITENGTDRHTRIQDVIFKMQELGMDIENLDVEEVVREAQHRGIKTEFIEWDAEKKEARCKNDDISIFFKADGVFRYKGKEVLFEIKTVNGFKFQKIVKNNQPLEEHIRQDTCYGMGLGIDYVLYLYEDRNFLKTHVMLYKITDEDKQYIIDKVKTLNYYRDNFIVPPKEEDKCQYCSFKTACVKWEEGQFFEQN